MMQKLEGDFAGYYNRRKHRSGAFWEDRFHCTMVEGGEHLWNCVVYIDLNMYRAGVVAHPGEWLWCGYNELIGKKTRYRLLDLDRLLESLGISDVKSFTDEYLARIEHAIAARKLEREKRWTESIAVGSKEYIRNIAAAVKRERIKLRVEEETDSSFSVW